MKRLKISDPWTDEAGAIYVECKCLECGAAMNAALDAHALNNVTTRQAAVAMLKLMQQVAELPCNCEPDVVRTLRPGFVEEDKPEPLVAAETKARREAN